METRNSKELKVSIEQAIDEYRDIYADCTPLDVQLALQALLEENL